jgi:RNA polymerase sigma-70 factor (ECF subfamily)
VQGRNGAPDATEASIGGQRRVVDAFLAAAQAGDFHGLLAVLDPDVVLRRDGGGSQPGYEKRGAEEVARGASSFTQLSLLRRPVLVNGAAGAYCTLDGKPFAVMAFTVRAGKITEIDIIRDPQRLGQLDLTALDE